MPEHIHFDNGENVLLLLDQRHLPLREDYAACRSTAEVVAALQSMVVRGAPAIGVTAAWGCLLALRETRGTADWKARLESLLQQISLARPTAVNLRWAVDRMRNIWHADSAVAPDLLDRLWLSEATAIQREDVAVNRAIGRWGAACIQDGDTIMTHCNAGALATAGYGTALGVIRAAWEEGKNIKVIANETRPFLQGTRLTAYELHADGIPVTVACDDACGLLMRRGMVQCVVVGADRIAANGDVANKIGTYAVALLAQRHGIPFFVAAPLSTVDRSLENGDGIPIEERPSREVTHLGGQQIVPTGVPVYNFAFDVTPAALISGIITEKGVLHAPYAAAIRQAFARG